MLDIKLHISAVQQPFCISVVERLLRVCLYHAGYPGKRNFLYENILTFDCFYSQTPINVEPDGLSIAKHQKRCLVSMRQLC